jgi:hypothetical protein
METKRTSSPRSARWTPIPLVLIALSLAGCGSGGSQRSRLTGTVTIGGKPASGATIRFFDDSNLCVAAGSVGGDGSYVATDVPLKQLRVAFEPGVASGIYSESPPPGTTPIPGSSAVPPAKIPEKFQKPESSGLSATVTTLEQSVDFVLD